MVWGGKRERMRSGLRDVAFYNIAFIASLLYCFSILIFSPIKLMCHFWWVTWKIIFFCCSKEKKTLPSYDAFRVSVLKLILN